MITVHIHNLISTTSVWRERKKGKMGENGMLSLLFTKVKPYLAMVCLQFGYAGMYIITMVSLKRGMNHWIFVVYRHVVATIVIAPFALVLERSFSLDLYTTPHSYHSILGTTTLPLVNHYITFPRQN